MTLSADDINFLITLIKKRSGISLTEQKLYLLESRLLPIARQHNFHTIHELVGLLRTKTEEALLADITEAMTTNESSFFRDTKPFEQFRDYVIPYLLKHLPNKKTFRIWSAACSSGQEPYSLAMTLLESNKNPGITFEIIATDIATHILDKAKEGLYSQFEVQRGIPITQLIKYFSQEGEQWRIKDNVKQLVTFQQCNLMEDFSHLGIFDIIFCRNVLIYFDPDTKLKVLEHLGRQLEPHGLLFLGGAESLFAQSTRFKPLEGQAGIHLLGG